MARPLRLEYEGAIYHVMARGNERGAIFRLNRDRTRFIEKLGESAAMYRVRVYAYTLMRNHWHGLIETPRGNLSPFMQQFNTSYTAYYNTKHQRVGHLYTGRYKAPRLEWMDYEPLLALVAVNVASRSGAYARFVEAGLNGEDEELKEAMGWSSKAIGAAAFCRQVELDLKRQVGQLGAPQDAAMRRMEAGMPPAVVESAVCTVCRVGLAEMVGRRRKSDARAMLMKLLVEYTGMTQRAAAVRLGLTDGSSVSRTVAHFNGKLGRDKRLQRLYREVEAHIVKH